MENLLVASLVVSGLGMLLLFIALAILYGLMYLMTTVLRDPTAAPVQSEPEGEQVAGEEEATHRAAVIGVALARARQALSPVDVPAMGEGTGADAQHLGVSAWWALHHDRQLTHKPTTRRTR